MRRTCRTTGRCAAEDSARPAVHRSSHDAWTSPRGPLHAVVDIEQPVTKHKPPQLQLQLNVTAAESRGAATLAVVPVDRADSGTRT